jgi:hypothetical protein
MNPYRADITVVTDISANIFAVFILILIILLVAREQTPTVPTEAPAVIDVATDLAAVDRAPLDPAAMVDLLYERRTAARSAKIDLFDDRIEVVTDTVSRRISLAAPVAPQMMPALPADAAVGLYVFGHRGYRFVTEHLAGAGRTWREISVPAALRRRDSAGFEDWSPGFKQLLARPQDIARFRIELARLLASPQPAVEPSTGGRAGANAPDEASSAPAASFTTELLERMMRWLRGLLDVISVIAGFSFIAWVEWSARAARVRS